jgi:hypothetical protein
MWDMNRLLLSTTDQEMPNEEVDEFPLPVAQDWDELLAKSNRMAEIIDKHLDFESKLQGRELRPITLCPEQKVSMVSDLTAV